MREHYLEDELLASEKIASLVKDRVFAQNLYAALCNMKWFKNGDEWTCSWRYAGELVSDLRDAGEDYLDFYCSGIGADKNSDYMPEGKVSAIVEEVLKQMEWFPQPYEERE